MTQDTQQVKRLPKPGGPGNGNGKLNFGLKNTIAVAAVTAALAFAGLARTCKPGPERIVEKKKADVTCPGRPSVPVKGDGKCEPEKGENNPYSDKYDPACGYCGDEIRQAWETKENCAYDFRCEQGNERYVRKVFPVFAPLENGTLELTTKTVTGSCKQGPVVKTPMAPGMTAPMVPDMEPSRPVVKAGGPCQEQPSGQLVGIKRTIQRTLAVRTEQLWTSGAIEREKTNTVSVRLNVDGSGHVRGVSISAAGKSIDPGSVGLSGLNGNYIGYPAGAPCTITVNRVIPSGTR